MNLKKITRVSILKTIYFNIKYLKFKGIIKPKFLISKNTILKSLRGGRVIVNCDEIFCIRIGFGDVAIFDNKYQRTIISNNGLLKFKGKASIGTRNQNI